ncbi:MAG: DUF5131 family protein, partial [Gemmatimonadaceae bacterium]|nr:DUF5131 family protein [Gemmatimonadaceae bacterium]
WATIPAAVRFISAEPLLGPLSLARVLPSFGWVIAGGESGPEARKCWHGWLRALRDECAAAGVPYFLKQLGGHPNARAHEQAVLDGKTHTEFPPDALGAAS